MDKVWRRRIGSWLLLGAILVYGQVMLGGITRLTGSGLSITDWDVIIGALPPLNQQQWQESFDKYKQFPQYKDVNTDMTLSGYKSIFFWEYLHRLWARSIGVVFVVGFLYFYIKRKLNPALIKKLIVVFILGGLEGVMGIIMVKSGLVDMPWVKPLDLTAHLLIALLIFSYIFWLALQFLIPQEQSADDKDVWGYARFLLVLTIIQIAFGGLMAGTHAALSYPTWPKFGTDWLPPISYANSLLKNLTEDVGTIQLVHRSVAYILCLCIIYFFFRYRKRGSQLSNAMILLLPITILVQIILGILTLLYSVGTIPVALGVLHQLVGWLTFSNILLIVFLFRKQPLISGQGL